MTVRCDEDILLAKVATVRRCVATIGRLWWEGQPPVEDWVRLDLTVLNLQRAVEACVDLANHVIAANAWGLPGSASESIQLLVEHGILTPTDLPIYRSMIGFRNIAVHNYRDIDEQIVTAIVRNHLKDLENFANRVLHATTHRD